MSQIATALLSGLLGALIVQLLNWLVASRAAVRRFQAAVRVVLDELQANIANLKIISNDRDPETTQLGVGKAAHLGDARVARDG
jgi:hypothetical protein